MKYNSFLILALLFIGIASCQKDNTSHQIQHLTNNSTNCDVLKIDKDASVLSEDDAINVANIFRINALQTKATDRRVIDVQTVRNSKGNPIIYGVNFDSGYILVSATKAYHPILAIVDEGRFDADNDFIGTKLLLSEYEFDMRVADSTSFSAEWLPYENLSSEIVKTRADDAYWDLLELYWQEWADEGCNVYYLYNQPEAMPDDVYSRFCSCAEDYDREDYNYMECSVIVEKFTQTNYSRGPFCPTQWDQEAPFNSALPNTDWPLGCTTIAAGQIMKYFQHPSSFDWAAMPNSTSNSTLSSFLKELHDEIGVDSSGDATITETKDALEHYGYNVTKQTHYNSDVINSIYSNKPVIMTGLCSTTGDGHAWVCDGLGYTVPRTEYRLFVIPIWQDPITSLEEVASETVTNTSYLIYNRMNWGGAERTMGIITMQIFTSIAPMTFTTLM